VSARTTFRFGANERVVLVGDSLTIGGIAGVAGVSVSWNVPLLVLLNSALSPTQNCRSTDGGRVALWDNQGQSSTDLNFWLVNAPSRVLGKGATTVTVALGRNDAAAGTTGVQARFRLNGICNELWDVEPGLKFLVLDAMENGEQWPDGANPFDANIDDVNTGLAAACDDLSARGEICYIPTRAWWFANVAPVYNPTNIPAGHFLTVDGLHLNGLAARLQGEFMFTKRVAP
jgi:GDSL-like Lipase/Acylhydrolase family